MSEMPALLDAVGLLNVDEAARYLGIGKTNARRGKLGLLRNQHTDRRIGLADRFYELKQRKSAHQGANHSHERMLVHMTHNVST
jgi:hypothetical protein